MISVGALILAMTLTSGSVGSESGPETLSPTVPHGPLATAAAAAAHALDATPEPWMLDRTISRPGALRVLYTTFGALQAVDLYSTGRALDKGASEVNPVMNKAVGNQGAMIAVKALTSASSIYFTERTWKKNRTGAVVLMAIVNGVTAAVVAHNLNHGR